MISFSYNITVSIFHYSIQAWYGHGMITKRVHDGILSNCDMGNVGPLKRFTSEASLVERDGSVFDESAAGVLGFVPLPGSPKDACDDFQNEASASMGNIDIYDVSLHSIRRLLTSRVPLRHPPTYPPFSLTFVHQRLSINDWHA